MRIPLDSVKRGGQVISLYTWYVGGKQIHLIPSPSSFNLVNSWRRQPIGNVTFWEPFVASHGQWWRDGSLTDAAFSLASIVAVTIHGRWPTYFYPYIMYLKKKNKIKHLIFIFLGTFFSPLNGSMRSHSLAQAKGHWHIHIFNSIWSWDSPISNNSVGV